MTEIKGHKATGCSAHLIDDATRVADDSRGSPLTPAKGNLKRSQRLGLLLMRNTYSTAPKLSTRRVITGFSPPEQRTRTGSCWLALETRSDNSQSSESAAASDCEAKKLYYKMLQSPHRLQLRWEGDSGVPGVVSVMQCGYRQCHGPQFSPRVQKSKRSAHYLRSRGAHSS